MASRPSRSSRSKNRAIGRATSKSPIESKPVSGPSAWSIRVLLFRMAPKWNCCTQPFSAFISGQFVEHGRLELDDLVGIERLAAAQPPQRGRHFRGRVVGRVEGVQTVVGKPAADRVKEIVPLPQGVEIAVEIVADVDAAALGQQVHPGVERRRRFHGHRLDRAGRSGSTWIENDPSAAMAR